MHPHKSVCIQDIMLKALLWKEWRENRMLILWGVSSLIGLTVIIYFFYPGLISIKPLLPNKWTPDAVPGILYMLSMLFLPFFGAIIGANIFGEEFKNKTINFLLIMPISYKRIFWVKTIFGIIVTLLLPIIIIAFLLLFITFGLKPENPGEYEGYLVLSSFFILIPIPFLIASIFMTIIIKTPGLGLFLGLILNYGAFSVLTGISIAATELNNSSITMMIFMLTGYILFCAACLQFAYNLFVNKELAV
jgi:ABC-type transport system involved in multi-copper enzyme maturation permease subunit